MSVSPRHALAATAGASALALVGLLVGGSAGAWGVAVAVVVLPVALMALGAARGGRLEGRTAVVLGLLALCLLASFVVLMTLRGGPDAVPASLLVLFGGVWLLPLIVVGVGYAVTFRHHGVRDDDLARLVALRRPGMDDPAGEVEK